MDYLIFLTKVVGKNLIYNPTIVRFLLIDVYADHGCSTPCQCVCLGKPRPIQIFLRALSSMS